MADHVRKQIRDAVVTTVTGLTTTTTNVFASRVYRVEDSKLPALLVYTNEEESEVLSMSRPQKIHRTVAVVVEGIAKATTALDDTLDTIAKEIETAIAADPTVGGLAKETVLTDIGVELTGDAQQPTGSIRLSFAVRYVTLETDPTTAL